MMQTQAAVATDFDDVVSTVRSHVFVRMMDLANAEGDNQVNSYRGDLFHDAVWLETYLVEPMTFYWGHGPSGTFIGDDKAVAEMTRDRFGRPSMYEVKVRHSPKGRVAVDFQPL